ncbi:uncharacterized protein ACA1_201110, partial [Acanthamoeba castellanii str. Neff]
MDHEASIIKVRDKVMAGLMVVLKQTTWDQVIKAVKEHGITDTEHWDAKPYPVAKIWPPECGQVWFNALMLEDYFLSFTMPAP